MMFMMLFRIYQLNHDREFFSPQQFETVVWWEFVIMIAVAQILFLRNKRMVEEKAGEQALMDTAREIQSGMVPREKEYSEGRFRISAFAQPARAVGGDFYDIIPLGDGKAGIVLGDVSGKGIPAALFMSMIKTMIRDRLLSGMSPEEALNQVNDAACAENPKGMFATVFAGVIDTGDGSLVFAKKFEISGPSQEVLTKTLNSRYGNVTIKDELLETVQGKWVMERNSDIFFKISGNCLTVGDDSFTIRAAVNNDYRPKGEDFAIINRDPAKEGVGYYYQMLCFKDEIRAYILVCDVGLQEMKFKRA